MKNTKSFTSKVLLLTTAFILIVGCSIFPAPDNGDPETPAAPVESATTTPTPTTAPVVSVPSEEVEDSRCKGLVGEIEMWVKVGPAEAVGLEPFAVGSAPFSVTSLEPPYAVQGSGPISYEDTLTADWGTYVVTLQMDTSIEGECSGEYGSERLLLALKSDGEQNVIVDAEDFHGEYPWAGSHTFNLDFPLEDGASIEGQGYNFILRLNQ